MAVPIRVAAGWKFLQKAELRELSAYQVHSMAQSSHAAAVNSLTETDNQGIGGNASSALLSVQHLRTRRWLKSIGKHSK